MSRRNFFIGVLPANLNSRNGKYAVNENKLVKLFEEKGIPQGELDAAKKKINFVGHEQKPKEESFLAVLSMVEGVLKVEFKFKIDHWVLSAVDEARRSNLKSLTRSTAEGIIARMAFTRQDEKDIRAQLMDVLCTARFSVEN